MFENRIFDLVMGIAHIAFSFPLCKDNVHLLHSLTKYKIIIKLLIIRSNFYTRFLFYLFGMIAFNLIFFY